MLIAVVAFSPVRNLRNNFIDLVLVLVCFGLCVVVVVVFGGSVLLLGLVFLQCYYC